MTLVILTKAFDMVGRNRLWKMIRKFCCPLKFTVRQRHVDMSTSKQNDGQFSESFPSPKGVKHWCELASNLFSIMFLVLFTDVLQDCDNGIVIKYRSDGKLFNLKKDASQIQSVARNDG